MKYQVKVDGKVFEVEVEKVGGGYSSLTPTSLTAAPQAPVAPVQAAPVAAPAAPAPAAAPAAPAPAAGGSGDVVAPMPGTVLRLNVNNGDTVASGDVILILEAMKMENEIVAPQDGTIASINVATGDSVEAGATLATLN